MRRYPNWPQRLNAAIETKRREPRVLGTNDCALCTADLVFAETGQDFGAPFRGRYHDEEGARTILAALGHDGLASLVDSCLPRGTGRPQRGDVVLQPHPNGDFLAVVWGGGIVGPGPDGLVLVKRDPAALFWKVG
jgi:hypothetical protein